MSTKLQSVYGLTFNPFRPDIPDEAIYVTPAVDAFLRRVQMGIVDGAYVMITGDPGTGKSMALRLLTNRLSTISPYVSDPTSAAFASSGAVKVSASVEASPPSRVLTCADPLIR